MVWPIIHPVLVISRAESKPSRSITGEIKPLSGSTKYCPFFVLTTSLARSAHARINDHDKDRARGIVRRSPGEKASAFLDRKRGDLVSDVQDTRVRSDAQHDGLTDGHGIVRGSEVRHENDGWARVGRRRFRSLLRGLLPGTSPHEQSQDEDCLRNTQPAQ